MAQIGVKLPIVVILDRMVGMPVPRVRFGSLSSQRNLRLAVALILGGGLALTPVWPHSDDRPSRVLPALQGLAYVGEVAYEEGGLAPHSVAESPQPTDLKPDTYYVFHKKKAIPISWQELIDRLRANGAEIGKAPASEGDLTHLTIGGPLFMIEFRIGGCNGKVFNLVDFNILNNQLLAKHWMAEDIVLVFEKSSSQKACWQ